MKKYFIVISCIISIILIKLCAYPANNEDLKSLNLNIQIGKRVSVTSLKNQKNVLNTLLGAAEETNVSLFMRDSEENPLNFILYAYFSNQNDLDLVPLISKMNYIYFNENDEIISSKSTDSSYKLKLIEDKYSYEIIPFHLINEKLRLDHIYVSSSNENNLNKFQEIVNLSGNLTIELIQHDLTSGVSNILLVSYLIFTDYGLVIGVIILMILMLFTSYLNQRNEVIKKLHGYSNTNLFFEKCKEWFKVYFIVMFACYPISFIITGIRFEFFTKLLIYYFYACLIIGTVQIVILFLVQMVTIFTKPNQILKKKENVPIYPILIFLKLTITFLICAILGSDLTNLVYSFKQINNIKKIEPYFENLFFLVTSDESQNVGVKFIENSEKYYNELDIRKTAYVSVLLDEKNNNYGSWIIANNAFINSLKLKTTNGETLYLESNENANIVTESKAEKIKSLIKFPKYCITPINDSCVDTKLYIIEDKSRVITLSEQGDLKLIEDGFFISTVYKALSYSQYLFFANNPEELSKLETDVSEVFYDIPLELKSFKEYYLNSIESLNLRLFDLMKVVTILLLIIFIFIVSIYQIMYDRYKQEILVRFLNGTSITKSSIILVVPQILTSLAAIGIFTLIYKSILLVTIIFLLLILLVELISFALFNIYIEKSVVRNLKGG